MPWPKGKPRSAETKAKIAEAGRGRKHSEETREQMSRVATGKVKSAETREKVRQARLKESRELVGEARRLRFASHGMAGKKHSPETVEKLRQSAIRRKMWLSAIAAQSPSKPEQKVAAMLEAKGEKYLAQHRLGYWSVDFFLPDSNTVIEVQGCYWHGCKRCGFAEKNKKHQAADKRKHGYLRKHGYTLVQIWEHDL